MLYFHIALAPFFNPLPNSLLCHVMLLFLFNLFFFSVFLFTLFRRFFFFFSILIGISLPSGSEKSFYKNLFSDTMCKSNLWHSCFLESHFRFRNCFTCPSIINAILHINDLLWNINHLKFLVLNHM